MLFERHAATADSDTAPASEPSAAPDASAGTENEEGKGRTSSSTRRTARRGLQRRNTDPAASAGASETSPNPGEPAAIAPGSAISSSTQEPSPLKTALAATVSPADQQASAAIPDADRNATRILSDDLELHLNQHTGAVTVRTRILLRNDGPAPLTRIPLQISSALQWQSAHLFSTGNNSPVALPMEQHHLTTDADHTGAASEASFTLPKPLAPGETASVELFYGGTLGQSAERLIRLGAPAVRAAQSDWDTVSGQFTGFRGFGNVLWFPVASAPLLLADGAAFVHAVEEERSRNRDTRISLRLTLETATATAPDAAFFHGERQPLVAIEGSNGSSSPNGSDDESTALYTAHWPAVCLGAHPLSLFLAGSAPQQTTAGLLDVVTEHADTVAAYAAAASRVQPLLTEWLGPHPDAPLHVLDLPFAGAQPFADGNLLVLPMRAVEPKLLAPSLVYPLSSAWLPPTAPPWLRDGLSEFLRLLYLERTQGRDAALVDLNAGGDLLARREGFTTASAPPLDRCVDSTCARTKAAFVLTMLRQIVGDDVLKQTLTAWRSTPSASGKQHVAIPPDQVLPDRVANASNHTTATHQLDSATDQAASSTARFEQILTQTSGKDLQWYFHDWIDRDAGLPDLQIVSVAPRRVERATVNNTVPAERRPTGGPIGPEPVPQPGDPAQQEQATQASRNRIGPAEGSWLVAVAVQNNGDAVAEVPVTVRNGTLQNALPLRIPAHSRATIRIPFEAVPEEVWVNDGTTPEIRSVTHHRTIDMPAQYR